MEGATIVVRPLPHSNFWNKSHIRGNSRQGDAYRCVVALASLCKRLLRRSYWAFLPLPPHHQRATHSFQSPLVSAYVPIRCLDSVTYLSRGEKHEPCLQIRLVTSLLCAFSGSLLTILELCTPTKGSLSRYTMESDCGNVYTTRNPFEVLDAVVEAQSNGSGSTGSPTSSGGSTSQKGYAGGGAALGTLSRGSVPTGSQLMQKERVSRRSLYIDCKQIADFSLRT
jgi:hypothetical protein